MTNATFDKAKTLTNEIDTLEKTVCALSASLSKSENWMMNLSNRVKRFSKRDGAEASAILLDGLDKYGVDLPVDKGLIEILKDYFEKQLSEKRKEFESL